MTAKPLVFLHTAEVHVATFQALFAELAPEVPLHHIVAPDLLADARAHGLTSELRARLAQHMRDASAAGAALLVCTCSTLGGVAEELAADLPITVRRIDRAMAEHAVRSGRRIVVAAALASTLAPTEALLREVAATAGIGLDLAICLCAEAWPAFERGDLAAYHQSIAADLRRVVHADDVIVLAQASMAGAAPLLADLGVPVLSSPRLGVVAAIDAYRE